MPLKVAIKQAQRYRRSDAAVQDQLSIASSRDGRTGRKFIMKTAKAVVVLLMLILSVPVLAQESQWQNQQQVNSLTSRERQIVLMVA
jgi:hypothetical protein